MPDESSSSSVQKVEGYKTTWRWFGGGDEQAYGEKEGKL